METKRTSGQLHAITSALFCAVLAAALLGSAGDGGCFGKPADQLCTETGGTWGPGEFWPTPCGADPLETKGAAAKEGESICACPADKPNWTDGVGCRKCESPREICGRTGGKWGPGTNWPAKCGDDPLDTKGPAVAAGQKVCACPSDRPNWTDGEGCKYCKTTREVCTGSGGTWGAGTHWPPECGDDAADGPGPAAEAGEKVCSCPAAKPNWSSDVGCRACKSNHQTCTESGGTWGSAEYWPTPCGDDPTLAYGPASAGKGACLCPANKPNWTDGTGCLSCAVTAGKCRGYSLNCADFDGYETTCWEQKGCYWDDTYDHCNGVSDGCWMFFNEWTCTAQRGCGWDPVSDAANARGYCYGVSDNCYYFDSSYDLCWMQRGCHFDYDNDDCEGSSDNCSAIYDATACSLQRGCTWRQR